jgi:hypothetical protein
MRGTRAMAVWQCIVVRDWYYGSGSILMDRDQCVVFEQWLYVSGSWSLHCTRTVDLW